MISVSIISNNKTRTKAFHKAALLLMSSLLVSPAFAADSGQHISKAGKHSALAVSHGTASTAKVASAVVAVPLIATGSVIVVAGTMSAEAGSKLMESRSHNDEIIISDITITADPSPQEAMNKRTVITTKTTIKTQEQK